MALFLVFSLFVGVCVTGFRNVFRATSRTTVDPRFVEEFRRRSTEVSLVQSSIVDSTFRSAARLDSISLVSAERPRLVDLNSASIVELQGLPKIGPVIARRIVEFRATHGPFKRLEDIRLVKGIGQTTYEKIQPHIALKEKNN